MPQLVSYSHGLAKGRTVSLLSNCVTYSYRPMQHLGGMDSKPSCLLLKDGFEGSVSFYHPITLGMVGGCVQLVNTQQLAHILH